MGSNRDAGLRGDIQGLRAIAVLLVVIYHVWPEWVPGGFVGVDVFFVISGFLITSHLRRELERSGSISLKVFYARRIRRLLPASSVVLVFVAGATVLLMPRFRWFEVATDITASTFYVQNWRLLIQSVDYLGAEEAAGPLQHFWSLAIEEQYYIVWPLILLAVAAVCPRRMFRYSVILVAVLVIGVSLYLSILVTRSDQSIAYFATYTRAWELAIGSLLAFLNWKSRSRPVAAFAGFTGLAMILLSAFMFSASTAFPGYFALLPTLGTALALWAGDSNLLHEKMLSLSPLKFLGDISYSLYLWHWPIIVFAGSMLPDGHDVAGGLLIVAVSVVLSWLSKRYVEDRFRGPVQGLSASGVLLSHFWQRSAGALAFACMGGSLLTSIGIYAWVATKQQLPGGLANSEAFPGAAAIVQGQVDFHWTPGSLVIPVPELARDDLPSSYGNKCHQSARHVKPRGCDIGTEDGNPVVVLVGDSHAANWIPAFEVLGREKNWRVVSYTKSACSLTLQDITIRGKPYSECTQWSRATLDEISKLKASLVVLGRSRGARLYAAESREVSDAQTTQMLVEIIRELRGGGARVAVMRDTPRMPFDPLLCFEDGEKCWADRGTVMAGEDPLITAAAIDGEARIIDMTDGLCIDDSCPVVIGEVLVWRDWHHITASYSKTLAPMLAGLLGEIPE